MASWFVHPEEHGAVGDGVHDDGPAFLAAAATGATVIGKAGAVYAMHGVQLTFPADFRMYGATLKLLAGTYPEIGEILSFEGLGAASTYFGGSVDGNWTRVEGERQSGLTVMPGISATIRDVAFRDCERHGVYFKGAADSLAENLTGIGLGRDVVSLEKATNTRVRNITGRGSKRRGTVEVADGCVDCIVENVYGDEQTYVVDFQDHRLEDQSNINISISGLRGGRVDYLLRSAAHEGQQHRRLIVSDVLGEAPIQIRLVDGVRISGVVGAVLDIADCSDVQVWGV